MSHISTNVKERATAELSYEPRSVDAENQKTDSNQPEEQLRELCQDLNSADRDLAPPDASPHASGNLESQLATRELLLDELIEQLGLWEKEIAGRRQTQQQEAQRLKAKQKELDQRTVELARRREQLHKDQIEAERLQAAAEARLEAFSEIEKSLNIAVQNQEGHRGTVQAPKSKASEQQSVSENQPEKTSKSSATGSPAALASPKDTEEALKPSPAPQPGPLEESGSPAAQGDLKSDSKDAGSSSSKATDILSTARFLSQLSEGTADSPSQETPAGPAAKPSTSTSPSRSGEPSDATPKSEHKASEQQREADAIDPSIQEYMNSLLGREKQGQPTSIPRVRPAPPPSPREENKSSQPRSAPKKPAENPNSAQALSPQNTAAQADISARMRELREVVNESTGNAVHHHSRERRTEKTQLVGVAVMAILLVCGVMYWFSQPHVQLVIDTMVMWFSSLLLPVIIAVAVVVGVGCMFLLGKRASTQSDANHNARNEPAESSPEASGAERTEPNPR